MKEKLKKFSAMPRDKLIKIIVIAGVVAIIGIMLSENIFSSSQKKSEDKNTDSISRAEYEEETEKRLCEVLSEIDGIGSCKVMVTLDTSSESVYSSDSESSSKDENGAVSSDEKSSHVIVDNDGEEALLEKEIQPKIRGVIVVCSGADNVYVQQAVTECIEAGLGVSSANISVVRGGKSNEQT